MDVERSEGRYVKNFFGDYLTVVANNHYRRHKFLDVVFDILDFFWTKNLYAEIAGRNRDGIVFGICNHRTDRYDVAQ